MEFFSDHWALWMCFFAPSVLLLGAARLAGKKLPYADAFRLIAWVAGSLLVIGLIHVAVGLIIP